MRKVILFGANALLIALLWAPGAWAFGWKDVRKMHLEGISDSLIVEKINHSGKAFKLEADDIRDLKNAGVSDEVIAAMIRTEDRYGGDYDDYYGSAYYGPAYYSRPYRGTSVHLGLGFGYGCRYYSDYGRFGYHSYYTHPRYYSYYGPSYGGRHGGGHSRGRH